ncbi:hypothetical protein DL240_06560 [Lujinxingia litoralis]|uniref:Outer membrane protein beta-barrel domain-containing protein n=1 Tax=Lujinxingia litoralis TaxID=2211119 RepID=A0A328CCZ4_9DELT|nr:hypothetical protein [Lujinxingia litoralis]RAL23811.1 hypothetical protein DL240_06560 [Lujinxingia litoralis]
MKAHSPQRASTFAALLTLLVALPAIASAQSVHMPLVGRQFPTLGIAAQGGAVVDLPDEGLKLSPAAGGVARVGLQHVIGPRLSMNADVGIGATWLGAHPMSTAAPADAEVGLAWQIAVLGRYFPIYQRSGLTLAAGVQYSGLRLADVPSSQIGLEMRAGYFRWDSEERFWTLEFGLSLPVLEGLSLPTDFTTNDAAGLPERSWHYMRASLGISRAF